MSAFTAIREAEALRNDEFIKRSKGRNDYETPLSSISGAYVRGEYAGGEDRPAYNRRGKKVIKGVTRSKQIATMHAHDHENDAWFAKASANRASTIAKEEMIDKPKRGKLPDMERMRQAGKSIRYHTS